MKICMLKYSHTNENKRAQFPQKRNNFHKEHIKDVEEGRNGGSKVLKV